MTLTKLTAHKKTCEHRKIKCQYCEYSYKPDDEEFHLQACGIRWKKKYDEKLGIEGLGIQECPYCKKRLSDQLFKK